MSYIELSDIQLQGYHGCHEAEAAIGGQYILNISVATDISIAAKSDDLSDTIDYVEIYNTCIELFNQRHDLLESLVYKMAHQVLDKFAQAEGVYIALDKLNPPIRGHVGSSRVVYSAGNYK